MLMLWLSRSVGQT